MTAGSTSKRPEYPPGGNGCGRSASPFLELAGARAPRQPLDGVSLLPLFRDPSAPLQRTAIFQHFPGYLGAGSNSWRTTPVSVIHRGDWKLMEFFEDGRLELYNLREDLGERRNLAAQQPEKARELHEQLTAWRSQVQAKLPTPHKAGERPPDFGRGAASASAE